MSIKGNINSRVEQKIIIIINKQNPSIICDLLTNGLEAVFAPLHWLTSTSYLVGYMVTATTLYCALLCLSLFFLEHLMSFVVKVPQWCLLNNYYQCHRAFCFKHFLVYFVKLTKSTQPISTHFLFSFSSISLPFVCLIDSFFLVSSPFD